MRAIAMEVALPAACADPSYLCWIEAHPGLAGYLQAVGAVVAIVATVILAVRSERRAVDAERASIARAERAEQAAEERSLALERRAAADKQAAIDAELDREVDAALIWGDRLRNEVEELARQGETILGPSGIGRVQGDIETVTSLQLQRGTQYLDAVTAIPLKHAIVALGEATRTVACPPGAWTRDEYMAQTAAFRDRAQPALDHIEALRSAPRFKKNARQANAGEVQR